MKTARWLLIALMTGCLLGCRPSRAPQLQDFLSGDDCTAPCWNGIQPGRTHVDEARAILSDQDIPFTEDLSAGGGGWGGVASYDIPVSLMNPQESQRLWLTVADNLVVAVVIHVDVCVSTVVESYGEPNIVYTTTGSLALGDHLHLVYLIDGLYLEFSVNRSEQDRVWRATVSSPEHHPVVAESTWEEVKDSHLDETCVDGFTHP